jgi:hypothetical protein
MGYSIDDLETALNELGYYNDGWGWCSNCTYLKPLSEFSVDNSRKTRHRVLCKDCCKEIAKQNYLANPEKHLKWNRKNYQENKEYYSKMSKQYRKDNPEKIAQIALNYNYAREQASVAWADQDKIKQIYLERDRLTQETKIPHHVDHIIPLQGKNVCGLHVHSNLQILTASENASKSNKFEPIIESFKLSK